MPQWYQAGPTAVGAHHTKQQHRMRGYLWTYT